MTNFENNESRIKEIIAWLSKLGEIETLPKTLRLASSDASFRKYFRVNKKENGSLIIMDAPPEKESIQSFIKVTEIFEKIGLNVPKIFEKNLNKGFLLLTDFGKNNFHDSLNKQNFYRLYLNAIDILIKLQLSSKKNILPEYSKSYFFEELLLFEKWYLEVHLKIYLSDEQKKELYNIFEYILEVCDSQSKVYVHKDYHSRNLMILTNQNIGILDHQDAVFGPITYDLVSLLKDVYIETHEEIILDMSIRYWEKARYVGLPINEDFDLFYKNFEIVGIQRHLKILGIFCRLNYRDGKNNYLRYVNFILNSIKKVCLRYPEFFSLLKILDSK
tara:strand:+ start:278 stop:1270 length:993 start_codon:yes stop_codon:yes gene_type:complete